jgi:hypothetical protein
LEPWNPEPPPTAASPPLALPYDVAAPHVCFCFIIGPAIESNLFPDHQPIPARISGSQRPVLQLEYKISYIAASFGDSSLQLATPSSQLYPALVRGRVKLTISLTTYIGSGRIFLYVDSSSLRHHLVSAGGGGFLVFVISFFHLKALRSETIRC